MIQRNCHGDEYSPNQDRKTHTTHLSEKPLHFIFSRTGAPESMQHPQLQKAQLTAKQENLKVVFSL